MKGHRDPADTPPKEDVADLELARLHGVKAGDPWLPAWDRYIDRLHERLRKKGLWP